MWDLKPDGAYSWPDGFYVPEFLDSVDYVVKYRQDDTQKAAPSGIIKLGRNGEVKVIRE